MFGEYPILGEMKKMNNQTNTDTKISEKTYEISFAIKWDMSKRTLEDTLHESLYGIDDKIITEILVEEMEE